MATLSPEQLARLRQINGQGGQSEFYDAASGQSFMPVFSSRYDPSIGDMVSEVTGYRGYDWAPGMYSDNYELNGKPYDVYDAHGNQTGQGTWEGLKKNSAMDTLLPLAMVAAPFALSMFPQLGAAASFGTNPVTGAAGGAGGLGGAASGLSGLPGGAGMDIAGFEGLTAADVGLGGAAAGGGAGAAGAAASGASKWLGPAATALGALAGAQGQKSEQKTERKMDPRMDPYIYGGNGQTGLLQYVQSQLDKQMAPGYMQGYEDMRTKGQGLIGQPIAGNGFNRFFPGR